MDPGGTPLGETFRGLVLGKTHEMTMACETFLFMASRAELVAQIIRPALQASKIVISDRFLLATVVYQGHAGGMAIDDIRAMGRVATGGIMPEATVILDLPVSQALVRRGRSPDRMEARSLEYHERVRSGFLVEAAHDTEAIAVVDASGGVEVIQSAVRRVIEPRLGRP